MVAVRDSTSAGKPSADAWATVPGLRIETFAQFIGFGVAHSLCRLCGDFSRARMRAYCDLLVFTSQAVVVTSFFAVVIVKLCSTPRMIVTQSTGSSSMYSNGTIQDCTLFLG